MEKRKLLALWSELLWWGLTAVLLGAVLYPVLSNLPGFPFLAYNAAYILVFVTLTRYVFFLRHTFLARLQLVKIVLIFLCPFLVFNLVQGIHAFQTYLDERGLETLMAGLPSERWEQLYDYLRSEYLLFGVGSIIVSALFPIRLIVSLWRVHNAKSV